MDNLVGRRTPAPIDWLELQVRPDLDRRRRAIEACRAELTWARADWIGIALTGKGWQEACLPHERAAARLLAVWSHLHPLEHRLKRAIDRLRAQRRAGWDWRPALVDLQRCRRDRVLLWQAFLAAAATYRDRRTGCLLHELCHPAPLTLTVG